MFDHPMKYVFITGISLFLFGCSKEKAKPKDQEPVVTTVTYKNSIEAILTTFCYNCHSPSRTYHYSGAGDLHTYDELVKRVENGTLKDRVLVKKNMPPAGFAAPNEAELKQLQTWLDNQYPLE
jgi:hypothetical protein